MKTYSIWVDNGVAIEIESDHASFNSVLDEFCANAGYIDHADYCQQMGLTESPFNIKEKPNENMVCND